MQTSTMNEYLQKFTEIHGSEYEAFKERGRLTRHYSWAVPTEEALQTITDLSPIVEVGAGTGYWGRLLAERGAHILCLDAYLGEENHYKHKTTFGNVFRGDERVLNHMAPRTNLLLCWPPFRDPMAANAVKLFRGRYLVYVGESDDGCTGDKEFHQLVYKNWTLVTEVSIPRWWGIYDSLYVYKRRCK